MRVRLLFFAVLRDIAGEDRRELTLPEGSRAADVWSILRERYSELSAYESPPLVAINESYAEPETVLLDGDELAFIPPVAGG